MRDDYHLGTMASKLYRIDAIVDTIPRAEEPELRRLHDEAKELLLLATREAKALEDLSMRCSILTQLASCGKSMHQLFALRAAQYGVTRGDTQ